MEYPFKLFCKLASKNLKILITALSVAQERDHKFR